MIAIQHTDCGFRIIHKNVVEDKEHSRITQHVVRRERINGLLTDIIEPRTHKAYKCMCCGKWWMDSITSPIVCEKSEYNKKRNDKSCKL